MLEKGKISAFQMGVMMYPTILATGFLSLPAITAEFAKNDLWLTPILASLTGFLSIFIATRLHQLYPKQSIIQYSERIVGKIPGKIIGMIYFIFWTSITGPTVRQYGDFVTGNFLFKTPILVIIFSLILFGAIAVRGGIELIARSAVIFTPIFILPIFFLLLLIPELDLKNVFPVLEHGIIPIIKGAAAPQAWFSEYFLITFFLPCLADPQKGGKWATISLCMVVLSMIYVNLITLFLFGSESANKSYPILSAFRYINVGNFFENLEALLLAMWVFGNFIKNCVFYYAAVQSLAQCLNLSDYRPVIFPIGLLIAVFSLWDFPSYPALSFFHTNVVPFELPIVLTVIPLLLLGVAVLRNRKATGKGDKTG